MKDRISNRWLRKVYFQAITAMCARCKCTNVKKGEVRLVETKRMLRMRKIVKSHVNIPVTKLIQNRKYNRYFYKAYNGAAITNLAQVIFTLYIFFSLFLSKIPTL